MDPFDEWFGPVVFRVYGMPDCVQCERTVKYLRKASAASVPGFRFQYVDVTKNEEATNEVRELGYAAAPVVVHVPTGASWYGFDPAQMGELITAWRVEADARPVVSDDDVEEVPR